ncbi:MFS transporter [Micromonospora sp. NPDC005686]|uniref:MFS transporter n=1 Tax=unclassified Micromonospora TaxID=2617518 RepID=UPI0033B802A4
MPRLTRDRITWLTYAQLGLWGFFLYGFGPVVPLLRDEQGTGAAVAGLHSTGIAVGALAGGALFAPVARRLGRGPAIWLGLAGVAAGAAALGLLRPLPATIVAVAVVATAGMLVISGVNVVLTARHGPAAPAALTEANAACAGMGILAPLVIGASVGAGLGWRPLMAVEVGLITLVALATLAFRVREPRRAPAVAAAGVPVPVAGSTRVGTRSPRIRGV